MLSPTATTSHDASTLQDEYPVMIVTMPPHVPHALRSHRVVLHHRTIIFTHFVLLRSHFTWAPNVFLLASSGTVNRDDAEA